MKYWLIIFLGFIISVILLAGIVSSASAGKVVEQRGNTLYISIWGEEQKSNKEKVDKPIIELKASTEMDSNEPESSYDSEFKSALKYEANKMWAYAYYSYRSIGEHEEAVRVCKEWIEELLSFGNERDYDTIAEVYRRIGNYSKYFEYKKMFAEYCEKEILYSAASSIYMEIDMWDDYLRCMKLLKEEKSLNQLSYIRFIGDIEEEYYGYYD